MLTRDWCRKEIAPCLPLAPLAFVPERFRTP